MKNCMISVCLVLLALAVATAAFAAKPAKQAPKPPLTRVTVAVTGFHCQGCPDELQRDLAKMSGVAEVKATLDPAQVTAAINEAKLTVSQFVNAIAKHPTGMDRAKTYGATLVAYITSPKCAEQQAMCDACIPDAQARFSQVKGVDTVQRHPAADAVTITFKPDARVTTRQLAEALKGSEHQLAVQFTVPAIATKTTDGNAPPCCEF